MFFNIVNKLRLNKNSKENNIADKALAYFESRKNGGNTIEYKKGIGYYLPLGILDNKIIGRIEEWSMKSGKNVVVKLIDYQEFSGPEDMVKESQWQLLGFTNTKLINDCTWEEFKEIYLDYLINNGMFL